ncbi:MAG TPA: glycosyltransferase family 2 protein [Chitinophagales bacterium]|nr:glycosyltransferase family 2 protein [Chitinophagales bacterium]
MKLSVVIPVYNASATIKLLVDELKQTLLGLNYEVVLVNDCSVDDSERICMAIVEGCKNVTLISLRKNAGEHNAVMCGLNNITGDCAVILDDDFQNPPSEIVKLYWELQKGYDVVYSCYDEKKHSLFRNMGSAINDFFATVLIGKPKGLYLSSFKIIHRDVVNEVIKYKGPFPYIDGLLLRVTSNIGKVTVKHDERLYGKSNYNISRLVSLYLNMFVNFSIKPLRLMIFLGFAMLIVGVVLLVAFITEKILNPNIPIGWTAIATLIITFSGFQILFLGVMGEYVGKQYLDQNATPQWTVKLIKTPPAHVG